MVRLTSRLVALLRAMFNLLISEMLLMIPLSSPCPSFTLLSFRYVSDSSFCSTNPCPPRGYTITNEDFWEVCLVISVIAPLSAPYNLVRISRRFAQLSKQSQCFLQMTCPPRSTKRSDLCNNQASPEIITAGGGGVLVSPLAVATPLRGLVGGSDETFCATLCAGCCIGTEAMRATLGHNSQSADCSAAASSQLV